MRSLLLAGAAALGMTLAVGAAQAAPVFGTTSSSNNQVIGTMEGWYGADLYLVGGSATLSVQLIGREAAASNSFNFGGGTVEISNITGTGSPFGSPGLPLGGAAISLGSVLPGLLDFVFTSSLGTDATNGSNPAPDGLRGNFFVSFGFSGDTIMNGSTPSSGTSVLIAFDDTGAGPDDNHDDLVIRLSIVGAGTTGTPPTFTVSVPEPASLAILGMGLLGLGAASRRRRRAA